MQVSKYYSGIGSRETPVDIQTLMSKIASEMNAHGFILRSGAADGADSAFEKGAGALKEIYIPWNGFSGRRNGIDGAILFNSKEALDIAIRYHPAGDRMSPAVKSLMTRNVYQVLGPDLASPSKVVICWTADGCETSEKRTYKTGGTGQAISIASSYGIPVINLANQDAEEKVRDFFLSRN